MPETKNTKREDEVSDAAAIATEATCYDNNELKRSKLPETDNSEIENDKVHGDFDAEEKQEKEEKTDSNDDNNDDDDVAEVCTLFLVKMENNATSDSIILSRTRIRQVTLCDPIWQMTPCSLRTSSRRWLYSALTF